FRRVLFRSNPARFYFKRLMKKSLLPTFILVCLTYICNMLKQFSPCHRPHDTINRDLFAPLELLHSGLRPGAKNAVDGQSTQLPLHTFHPDTPASTSQKITRIRRKKILPGYRTYNSIHPDTHFLLELLDAGFSARAKNAVYRQPFQLPLNFLDYFPS